MCCHIKRIEYGEKDCASTPLGFKISLNLLSIELFECILVEQLIANLCHNAAHIRQLQNHEHHQVKLFIVKGKYSCFQIVEIDSRKRSEQDVDDDCLHSVRSMQLND